MVKFFKNLFKGNDIEDQIEDINLQSDLALQAEETMVLAREISSLLQNEINDTDKKLISVCNLLQDQLLIVDLDGVIQFVNLQAKTYFTNDVIGSIFNDTFHIENIENINELYKSTKLKNKLDHYNVIIENIEYKMDISMSYISFEDKRDVYVILLDNITERVDYEQDLLESNEKFKIFSELTNDGMVITSDDTILTSNGRFCIMAEYLYEDLSSINFDKIIQSLPLDNNFLRYETVLTTKFGKEINVSINKSQIIWNDIEADIYVIRDITRFKNVEKSLENKAERFSALLNSCYISLCCFDSNMNITYVNDVFLEENNVEKTQIIFTSILDFLPVEDRTQFIEDITQINSNNSTFRSLHFYNDKLQDWICFGKFDEFGRIEEYQCSIRDITNYFNKKG